MIINSNDFQVKPGKKIDLSKWPTRVKPVCKSEKKYQKLLRAHVAELSSLQNLHYASNKSALLLIFQGMDAAGKDGAIRHVMSGVNPQGCEVFSFKQPTAEELEHDFLWRTTCRLPERGRIGIFNRSYYEEVLVVRVHPELLKIRDYLNRCAMGKVFGKKGIAPSWIWSGTCTLMARGSSSFSCTYRRTSNESASSNGLMNRTRTGSSVLRIFVSANFGSNT
jgi:hypothetical protein